MKTAMQLAIEHYEKLSLQGSNQAYVVANFLKENFLEMEKQQMIEFAKYTEFIDTEKSDMNKVIDFYLTLDGEEFIEETFKSE
jgi:hypothetical protein